MFKNAGLVGLFTRHYQWRDERGFMIPKHHGGHFFGGWGNWIHYFLLITEYKYKYSIKLFTVT